MSAKREIWVLETGTGYPTLTLNRRALAFVWESDARDAARLIDRVVKYVPAPSPRKRRKR